MKSERWFHSVQGVCVAISGFIVGTCFIHAAQEGFTRAYPYTEWLLLAGGLVLIAISFEDQRRRR